MQRISFAPVLSATRSRDSCWITSLLLCLRSAVVAGPVPGDLPAHGRTAAGCAGARPRPSGPRKLSAQSGPVVHGTRTGAGAGTWGWTPCAPATLVVYRSCATARNYCSGTTARELLGLLD